MKYEKYSLILILFLTPFILSAQTKEADVICAGGGKSENTVYKSFATFGQPSASRTVNLIYKNNEGFLNDYECIQNLFISDLYTSADPGWGYSHFDDLDDAIGGTCGSNPTVNISNYTHSGDVDMTGYTFIIGEGDFDLNGNLTGGFVQTPNTGALILPAVQNVQRDYPMGDGNNNYTLKIIPMNAPTNSISVRLYELIVPRGIKSPMQFWEIEGDDNLDATIIFRIDKSAIAPKTLNTNSILRYFNGNKYLPMSQNQVTINDEGTYYEIIIINVNQF